MKNRLMTLLLALTLGGIAASLVYMYVQRVEEDSTRGLETRSVLVAAATLAAGTPGTDIVAQGAYEVKKVPVRWAAPGAFTTPDQLATPGLTLANDVAAGEQLTSVRFESTETDAFLAQFPEGTEALSLPLEHVKAVAGHVKAGDKINAYVTGNRAQFSFKVETTIDEASGSGEVIATGKGEGTFLLLSDILVMEVQNAAESGQDQGTITLAVTGRQAAALIGAQETARLWFTLVPDESAQS